MKGYQIIETEALNTLLSDQIYDVFAVAILAWLCDLLRLEFESHLEHVEFEVICAAYLGSYPAIGIHYKNPDYQDLGPLSVAAVDRVLREKSALDLAKFIGTGKTNWKEVAKKILSRSL